MGDKDDKNKIELRLVADVSQGDGVDFTDFREFCDHVAQCLRRVEAAATSRRGKIKYKIVGLAFKSAGVTLEAIKPPKGRDTRPKVLGLFRRTIGSVIRGRHVDTRLTSDDLNAFRKLVTPLSKNSKEIWIDERQLTPKFASNIDKLLDNLIQSTGSVRGKLEKLNVHNASEFVLYPPISGHPITCTFSDALVSEVRQAIKRSVTVTGRLFFRPDRAFPDKVHVESMLIHAFDDNLPGLLDLRGMAPGCTGDLSAVDFVQALRND